MKLYNTASRKVEDIVPIIPGKIGIYSCGPTVYSSPHIGNMYAYICWDALVRSLKFCGYDVRQVMNITDVGHLTSDGDEGEDKMEKGSHREGLSVWEIAKKYEQEFMTNMEKLHIEKPWKMPRATQYISQQIELVKKIEKNGFTYRISDGIYFDTSKFLDYAKFANLKLDEIRNTERNEISKEKRNLSDFALWKLSPNNGLKRQMEWESPWGVGFPGWHIECTAMSTDLLGETFDIHTGGIDHIPVHHTNEIAQAFGAFGHQTANYWVHNGFLTFSGSKISKSSGGMITIFDLEADGFHALDYRFMVLNSHYRKGLEFSLDNLKSAHNGLHKIMNMVLEFKNNRGVIAEIETNYLSDFKAKLNEDLALPEAMAIVWKLLRSDLSSGTKMRTLYEFDKVLGFGFENITSSKSTIPMEIELLVNGRDEVRKAKKWEESDRLRKELEKKGFVVEDTPNGTKIKKMVK